MLARLIRGWLRLDPQIWEESDRQVGSPKACDPVDRPSNSGGVVSSSGDALIPALLLRFHP